MRSTPVRRTCRSLVSCCLVAAACATVTVPARAQDAPAHVVAVEGAAWIDGEVDTIGATPGEVVAAGDRVRTAAGHVEIWLADGTVLALDDESALELQSPGVVRLMSGRLWAIVPRSAPSLQAESHQIDTPLGSIILREAGEYRVGLGIDARLVELVVRRGTAELTTPAGAVLVRSGEQAMAQLDGPPSRPVRFNTARRDAFDDWVASRRDAARGRAASSSYLPDDLRAYAGTFDQYGSWDYEPSSHGYVWYPAVDVGWRPYSNGYWRALPTHGWTWIGLDPWGWPAHHYGRWGYTRARWYWIPERHWAPAWVSWASAPGYVSWCPLGFDGRPVFGFSLSVGSTWSGWTVMSRGDFGRVHTPVARYAVQGARLSRSVPFAVHANAPILPLSVRNRAGGSVVASGWRTTQRDDGPARAAPRAGYADRRPGPGGRREPAVDRSIRAFSRDRGDRGPAAAAVSPGAGQVPSRSERSAASVQSGSSGWALAPGPAGEIQRGDPRARRPPAQADSSPGSDGWRMREESGRRVPYGGRPSRDARPTAPQADRGGRSTAREMPPQPHSEPQAAPRAESRRESSGESTRSDSRGGSGARTGNGGGGVQRRRP